MEKIITRRLRQRFWIIAMGCFGMLAVLSVLIWHFNEKKSLEMGERQRLRFPMR